MAKFSQKTISEIGGSNDTVYAQELLYGSDTYWNVTVSDDAGIPYDLSTWSFSFRLIRRVVQSITEGRYGIEIEGLQRAPRETEVNLDTSVKVYDPVNGKVRILIDKSFFNTVPSTIDSDSPPVYTGYFAATSPGIGVVGSPAYIPPQTKKILLLFIVRSDGCTA
jgi:hypothetical protein